MTQKLTTETINMNQSYGRRLSMAEMRFGQHGILAVVPQVTTSKKLSHPIGSPTFSSCYKLMGQGPK